MKFRCHIQDILLVHNGQFEIIPGSQAQANKHIFSVSLFVTFHCRLKRSLCPIEKLWSSRQQTMVGRAQTNLGPIEQEHGAIERG